MATILVVDDERPMRTLLAALLKISGHTILQAIHGQQALEMISDEKPDLVIADEAHCLRHKDAARTRRFLRYMRRNPATRFVCLSGTLTEDSILNYAHLLDLGLRDNAPLPRGWADLTSWSAALDVGAEGGPGALIALCGPLETVREGYRRRLVESPGVVATSEDDLGVSLIIRERAPKAPSAVRAALKELAGTWAWDGVEYEQALDIHRLGRQLTAGFYYRAVWPTGTPDLEWLAARRDWDAAVRRYLTHTNREGKDSPALLEELAEVNEDVSADDEVELGEGGVAGEVLSGEDAEVADGLADAVAAVTAVEEASEALG